MILPFIILLVLLLLTSTPSSISHTSDTINTSNNHNNHNSIRKAPKEHWIEDIILFQNKLIDDTITICLIDTGNTDGFCIVLDYGGEEWMKTFIGSKWSVTPLSTNETHILEVVGGKHIYSLDKEYFTMNSASYISTLKEYKKVIYIKTPDFCDERYTSWDVLGPTWRDGLRSALYRRNYDAACMCGEHNVSSTYTVDAPSHEVPFILSSKDCNCSNRKHPFHFWLPCTYGLMDPTQFAEYNPCTTDDSYFGTLGVEKRNVRIALLHMTTFVDFLTLKNKLYRKLRQTYGDENAALIMPRTYDFSNADDFSKLIERCKSHENEFYIFKDPIQHRQMGTNLVSSSLFLKQESFYRSSDINMATVFLSDPFLVRGHKINIRRYMLVVCTGTELLGYVHESGKNIYTKRPYREPWNGKQFDFETDSGTIDLNLRQEEIITTGYVTPEFYDGKPLNGKEFVEWVKVVENNNADKLWQSMATRLALILHANGPTGDSNLCDTDPKNTEADDIPSCLKDSIRFQLFGCDFHIDSKLTGYESRVFECNKGPDMSVHSLRDGTLKRNVAADVLSFIDFAGSFKGSSADAAKYDIHLIYNSTTFDESKAFKTLNDL